MKNKKFARLDSKGISHLLIPLLVVVVFVASIGTYTKIQSSAATDEVTAARRHTYLHLDLSNYRYDLRVRCGRVQKHFDVNATRSKQHRRVDCGVGSKKFYVSYRAAGYKRGLIKGNCSSGDQTRCRVGLPQIVVR